MKSRWHHSCLIKMNAISPEGVYEHQRKETYHGLAAGRHVGPSTYRAKTLRRAGRDRRNYTAGAHGVVASAADIRSENLFYGPGGKEHEPHGPFTFVKEDLNGTNPKYDVRDQDGVKWKIKLGAEARPETVATRFVWAVGYHADEDYFLPEVRVMGLPAHVHRGEKLIGPGG